MLIPLHHIGESHFLTNEVGSHIDDHLTVAVLEVHRVPVLGFHTTAFRRHVVDQLVSNIGPL